MPRLFLLAPLLLPLVVQGCVRRQIDITSTPGGALVRVNDREVGRTPCRIEFDHYGLYDVRLSLDGYESVVGVGRADAPFWDWAGIDLIGELAPWNAVSDTDWHFNLVPDRSEPDALVVRARALQSDLLALEAETPVEHVTPTDESAAAAARRDGERGVVPSPPTVLQPATSETPAPNVVPAAR